MKNVFWLLILLDSIILIFIRIPLSFAGEDAASKAREGGIILSVMSLIGISIALSYVKESALCQFLSIALGALPPLIILLMSLQRIRKIQ